MAFWVILAVFAFTFLVSPLLAPKPKGLNANLGDVQPPTAEKGTPIPVVFGTQKIAPNVVWYGNVRAEDIRTVTGNRTLLNPFAINHSTVTGHRYGADIAGALCHGPIDELIDFQFSDISLRKYISDNANYVTGPAGVPVLTTPMTPNFSSTVPAGDGATTYSINAPDLNGGDDGDGGVKALIEFWWGKLTQNASAVLAVKVGTAVSRYKGLCHFVMHNATFGTSPYLKPFFAVVRRTPQIVSPDAATANISGSANPADAIFEIMTNARWGLGKSPADFDIPSFAACAVTLKAEGMGIDVTLNSQDQADALIGEIERHIDAVLFPHPLTGKITLKLIRADYVVVDLLRVNKSNCIDFSNFKRTTWPQTINEVRVNYVARGVLPAYTFKRDTQQAQNLASLQAMGDIASTTLDFGMFSSADRALKTAFRTLRAVSSPLATGSLTVNRKMSQLTVGSVFVLDWEPLGLANLVMRVMNIEYGTLDNNAIKLQVSEDVYSTAPAVFTPPPSTQWVAPSTTPIAHVRAVSIPAPYWLTKADSFIGLNFVVRANGVSASWDGLYNPNPAVSDTPPVGVMATFNSTFTPAGTLISNYLYSTAYQDEVGFIVQDLASDLSRLISTDAAGLVRGDNLAWIASNDGGELISWREIIPQATPGQYLIRGVLRGQFDTLPLDHSATATIYFFWPDSYASFYPGMETGVTAPPTATSMSAAGVGYKFWPSVKGVTSSLPPAVPAGRVEHVTIPSRDPQRAVTPLPVGDLQLNTVKNNVLNPATLLPDSNSLTWVSRNRLLQTAARLHDAAADATEASEVYEVEIRHVSRTTGADIFGVIHTYIGAASPLTYTNEQFELDIKAANGGVKVPDADSRRTGGGIRFLVRSVRGTLKSIDAALPGFRRTQEVGYPIIPSLQFTNIASLLVPAEPPFVEQIQQGVTVTNT